MSLEQSQGIQALLAAEKAASETIMKARKKKQLRLKQAQDEAEAEVTRYKREREEQFQSYVGKQAGAMETAERMAQATKEEITSLGHHVAFNKEGVIQALLEALVDVKPRLHVNYTA